MINSISEAGEEKILLGQINGQGFVFDIYRVYAHHISAWYEIYKTAYRTWRLNVLLFSIQGSLLPFSAHLCLFISNQYICVSIEDATLIPGSHDISKWIAGLKCGLALYTNMQIQAQMQIMWILHTATWSTRHILRVCDFLCVLFGHILQGIQQFNCLSVQCQRLETMLRIGSRHMVIYLP